MRVTAPALRPAVGLGALLVVLYTFSDFGVVSLMDYDTLTRAIYIQYKSLFDRAPAATLALLLVALTAIALVVEYRTRQRGRLYRSGPGLARGPSRSCRSVAGQSPALAFCTAVVGVFLVLPAGVLGYWLVRGIANERELGVPWTEALHSLEASGLAAAVAVLAALPVAVLALRYPSRRRASSSGSPTRGTPCRASSSRSRSSSSRPATRRPSTRPSRSSSSPTSSASSRRRSPASSRRSSASARATRRPRAGSVAGRCRPSGA